MDLTISCPFCDSSALYKYGKTKIGKERFQCLMCNRQFSMGATRQEVQGKPNCANCGKKMHLYKIEGKIIRFRCSDYPACKTYKKFKIEEDPNELLHS